MNWAVVWALGWLVAGVANATAAGKNIQTKNYGLAGCNTFMAILSLIYLARYIFR